LGYQSGYCIVLFSQLLAQVSDALLVLVVQLGSGSQFGSLVGKLVLLVMDTQKQTRYRDSDSGVHPVPAQQFSEQDHLLSCGGVFFSFLAIALKLELNNG